MLAGVAFISFFVGAGLLWACITRDTDGVVRF